MKLAILGGGGFRIPLIYRALMNDRSDQRITEVTLYDTADDRLRVIESVLAAMASTADWAPSVNRARTLEEAVTGARFVFSAVRVGGLAGRIRDERLAIDLGVLGQETTGPGGLNYGLRTIPVAMQIAAAVRDFAPSAWVLNFTNPAGMITQAMQRVLGERVIGICDAPESMVLRIALAAGFDRRPDAVDYVGLNHLGWLRGMTVDGTDLLPSVLADDVLLGSLEEGQIFGIDWLRAQGCIPNEYLYYYDFTREAVAAIQQAGSTRGEYLQKQQSEFYTAAAAGGDVLGLWQRAVDERQASYLAEARTVGAERPAAPDVGGYERVALEVMTAIAADTGAVMILNVRNGSAVAGLPTDAVVEVASRVDSRGAHPLATAAPTLSQLGLMQQVKAVEELTIRAADTGSADDAWLAFARHPLVDSANVARQLVSRYFDVGVTNR